VIWLAPKRTDPNGDGNMTESTFTTKVLQYIITQRLLAFDFETVLSSFPRCMILRGSFPSIMILY
jgi:hypothetical protein